MRQMRTILGGVVLCWMAPLAGGQTPAPLADRVEDPILPAGISELPVHLSGELAYLFRDEPDTITLHVVGDFKLTLGLADGQELTSHEALLWMTTTEHQGQSYRRFEIMLWRDARIRQAGGTVTEGPALFVTLASFGEVTLNVDDVAPQANRDTDIYSYGGNLRRRLAKLELPRPAEDVSLQVFDASGLAQKPEPKVKPKFSFRAEDVGITEEDGRRILTATGRMYLAYGTPGTGSYLEVNADSAVLFVRAVGEPGGAGTGAPGAGRLGSRTAETAGQGQLAALGLKDAEPEAVYLEGDIVLAQGRNVIRADRLYYDFVHQRALILDAIVRTSLTERNLPLYLRAQEIRQLSPQQYAATDALITTSEFYTPHYHVGARHIELADRTAPDPTGARQGVRAGRFRIRDATLNVAGYPIAYWPYIYGDIDTSETSIRGLRSGYSDEFGFEVETDWDIFNLLGLERKEGFEPTLSLDSFTERGPALGVDAEYEQDRYLGLLRSYLIWDEGEDTLGRERQDRAYRGARGRLLWRHRQFLEDDWQVSLELSYLSDRNFLEEFFEREFDLEKEQETLLYLKKQTDNWALTGLAQARVLDFYTQTEHLPELTFRWIGEPVGSVGTLFSENRAGIARLRGADQSFFELWHYGRQPSSGSTARLDSRQEVEFPLDWGPVRLVPFCTVRGSGWDSSRSGGGLWRAYAVGGVRASTYLSRVYPDVESELWDVHGLRHVIKPSALLWAAGTNHDADELHPLTYGVETVDEVDGATVAVRQRWQTKRGEADNQRVVDVLTIDLSASVFNDSHVGAGAIGYTSITRPENSIPRNHVDAATIWRVNDRTAVLSEANYDLDDGELDLFNLSVAVERPPRLGYLVGYRFIKESDSSLLGFGANYQLTEKHTLALRELIDLDEGRTAEFTVGLIRRFPRWFAALSFELDDTEDDFGVSLSVWPEGLPRAVLGSRRFTGLGTTTRMTPE